MTQQEFEALVEDQTKAITGPIEWSEDADHSTWVEFSVEVESEAGYPIFVKGSYNGAAKALSYVLIHRGVGRIYALDLGKDHHNPSCTNVGEKHKHRWDESQRDKNAYVPEDITAPVNDPVAVWRQFCIEAKIRHEGTMKPPVIPQLELF